MSLFLMIVLPLLFAAATTLYTAWELPRRLAAASECDEEKLMAEENRVQATCDGTCLTWGGLWMSRRGLIAAGVLSVAVGIPLLCLNLFFYGNDLEYTVKLLFCYELLVAAGIIDFRTRVIPNRLLLAGLVCWVIFTAVETAMGFRFVALLRDGFLGLLLGGGIFLLCSLLTRGGMGMGDVKLFGLLGLYLGWTGIFDLIFLSVMLVAAFGIVMLLRQKLDRRSQAPIGPFALAGMTAMLLLGV